MLKTLKKKFVLTAMLALTLLLILIVTGMNIINFGSVKEEADQLLSLISEHHGHFPELPRGHVPPDMSPEVPYESRFFTVLLDPSGKVIDSDISRIRSVDGHKAEEYARKAMEKQQDRGFLDDFRYVVTTEGKNTRLSFLDCGRKLHAAEIFLLSSIGMSLAGLVLVFALMMFSAERIIRPVAESYEKQRRFITDAGHELKTPLTIIRANAELLEMDTGENECIRDIQQQALKLSRLTEELVYLARMEESTAFAQLPELPISDIVLETVQSFKAVAQNGNKELCPDIEPMLSMKGEHRALEQLVGILTDNALKYSPEGSRICVKLSKQGRTLRLSVKNRCTAPVDKEELRHMFERFYRGDSSRSSSGGHGIGLSTASAIVSAHGGKIHGRSEDGESIEIIVNFPI